MTTFEQDFAAALRGEPGYAGIQPETAAALFRLGLITEEQAWEGALQYQRDWKQGWDDSNWWWALADVACEQYRTWWQRFIGLNYTWKSEWIRERRGW